MRNIHISNLGYFERQILIDRVSRAIAASQGWQITCDSNILESSNPRLRSCVELALVAIEEIETYLAENKR